MTANETIAYLKQVVAMEEQLMQLRVASEELRLHRSYFAESVSYQMKKQQDQSTTFDTWLETPFSLGTSNDFDSNSIKLKSAKYHFPNLYAIKGENIVAPTGLALQKKFFLDHYTKPQFDKNALRVLEYIPLPPAADPIKKKKPLKPWLIWLIGILCIFPLWLSAMLVPAFLIIAIILTIFGLVIIFAFASGSREDQQKYELQLKAQQDYEQAVKLREHSMSRLEQAYASAAEKATKAYCSFAEQRNQKILQEEDKFQSLIKDAELTLQRLYNQNVIHAKYRNLAACCMFLEYLETERCEALTGVNGAYNLYESELRQNLIIYKLDEVVQRLDALQTTMYRCCQAVESVRKNLDVIHRDLQKLNTKAQKQLELSTLSAVYAAAAAANTSALQYLALIS